MLSDSKQIALETLDALKELVANQDTGIHPPKFEPPAALENVRLDAVPDLTELRAKIDLAIERESRGTLAINNIAIPLLTALKTLIKTLA